MAPKSKTVLACKAMKNLGYSEKIVRPILKDLLNVYESNWMLIEDDSYRVLVEAILDSEEQKAPSNVSKRLSARLEDEADDNIPLMKRYKLSRMKNQSSPSVQGSNPNCSNEGKNQKQGKQILAKNTSGKHQNRDIKVGSQRKTNSSPPSRVVKEQDIDVYLISDDENDEANALVPFVDVENRGDEPNLRHDLEEIVFGKYMSGVVNEVKPLAYDLSDYEFPLPDDPPDPPRLLLQGSSFDNGSAAEQSSSIYPEAIDLDSEDISHALLPKEAFSVGTSLDLEENHSESVNRISEAEKDESDGQDSLTLDIASSSRGEAKLSLMINASLGSDFRLPSLEAVLKQVEEQCLKSYRIPQVGFSLLGLMKEVCECFLAASTTSMNTENEPLSLGNSGGPDSENGSLSLISKSNDSVTNQNYFEVSPQIPRFVGSVHMGLSRCRLYLNASIIGSIKMNGNIMELINCAPSSSEIVSVQDNRLYHCVQDITKGQEACEISLINEVNDDQGPAFKYINKNVTYRDACLRFHLARITAQNCCSNCYGNCLSLETPCACSGKTGFEFAYTPGGLVKENFLDNFASDYSAQRPNLFYCHDCPLERSVSRNLSSKCKGHITRKFIKECWYKCGCSMKCGNRVVQRGITTKLQVFMTSDGKGWGLRTLEDVPKGAFICEYVGEVVTIREMFQRNVQNAGEKHIFAVVLDADWSSKSVLKDEEALCLDSTFYGNIARFINHRCFDANLVGIPVEVETPDHHYYHLAFFTTRKVNAFEEMTWDYGIEFNGCDQVKAFQCCCGSKFCRDH